MLFAAVVPFWRRIPLFTVVQALGIIFISLQVVMFYSHRFTPDEYKTMWLATDQISLVFDVICFAQLFDKFEEDTILYWFSFAYIMHVVLKIYENLTAFGMANYGFIYSVRYWMNLILTLLLAGTFYHRRTRCLMSDIPKKPLAPTHPHPDDEPIDPGGNDGGAPPTKPGHGG